MIRGLLIVFALLCGGFCLAAESLNILVYGASGEVGSHIVTEALERGHRVTAVSRDPSRITLRHDNLQARAGDLLDAESIDSLLAGHDVVVISVRGVIGEKVGRNALQRIAVENVVDGIRRQSRNLPRLIHIGGSGTLEIRPGVLYADAIPNIFIKKRLEAEIEGQILALEYLRGVSDVAWSYVTPPKRFTNGERTGEYRTGGDQVLKNKRGRSRISRADFAVAVIDEIESAAHSRRRFTVAY